MQKNFYLNLQITTNSIQIPYNIVQNLYKKRITSFYREEVQVAVKDAAQEAQEAQKARVNCKEANVSQKLLLKDVEKKVKMKVKMKKKKFCSLLPNKKPYKSNKPHLFNKPNKPTYSTNPTKPNGPTNPTTVCPSPSITTISTI